MRRRIFSLVAILIPIMTFVFSYTAAAGGIIPEDFYKGRTITMVIPYSAGGGTDSLGRLFARYLSNQIGANIMVVNKAGGGGIEGPNYMYTVKNDGSVICYDESGGGTWGAAIRKDPAVQYDFTKFEYIGFHHSETGAVWIKADGPYKSIQDLQKAKGLKFATLGPTSGVGQGCALSIEALGLDAKIVTGLKGRSDIVLALQKREADAIVFAIPGMESYLKGELKVLCTIGLKPTDLYLKYGGVAITNLVSVSNELKQLIDLYETSPDGKSIFLPPGTPKDRVDYLKKAFVDICKLPDYQTEVTKFFSIWPGYLTGDQTLKEAIRRSQNAALYQKIIDLVLKYKG